MTASVWKKQFSEVVDKRDERLPPAWLTTGAAPGPRGERGRDVHLSGPGRVVANDVIKLLEKATEKAVVSTFLLADGDIEHALFSAAQRGVRVYVLVASEARLGREEPQGEFDKKVFEQHTAMLHRLGGHVLFRTAQYFHAKVVIIDPGAHVRGMLLTANLTAEALERNEEIAISLTPDQANEVTEYLKWAMWEYAEHEFIDPKDRLKSVQPLGRVPHPAPSASIVATTSVTQSIRDEALRLIASANNQIVVSSFGWDKDHEIVRRLCGRARDGLDVVALARIRPSSMPALRALVDAGAKVLGFEWLHAKAIWVDTQQALVMSANLQADGLDTGFELGVRLTGSGAGEIFERLAQWGEGARWRLAAAPSLREATGKVGLWDGNRLEEVEVMPSATVNLGSVTAASAHDLQATQPPRPAQSALPPLAHEIRYTWTVVAPGLAEKSTEIQKPAEGKQPPISYAPQVFREPAGRLVVAVRSPAELARARDVMTEVDAEAIVVADGSTP